MMLSKYTNQIYLLNLRGIFYEITWGTRFILKLNSFGLYLVEICG